MGKKWTCPFAFLLLFFCFFDLFFFAFVLLFFCFFLLFAWKKAKKSKIKAKQKQKKSKSKKQKKSNKNANGQVHFFPFFPLFVFPFCFPFFSLLFCFCVFWILLICFLVFPFFLHFSRFFSSFKKIRISYGLVNIMLRWMLLQHDLHAEERRRWLQQLQQPTEWCGAQGDQTACFIRC